MLQVAAVVVEVEGQEEGVRDVLVETTLEPRTKRRGDHECCYLWSDWGHLR